MRFERHAGLLQDLIAEVSCNDENLLAMRNSRARTHLLLKIHSGVIASRTYAFMPRECGRLSFPNQFFNSVVLSLRLM